MASKTATTISLGQVFRQGLLYPGAAAGAAVAFFGWRDDETNAQIRRSAAYWRVADVAAAALRRVPDAETAHSLTLTALRLGFGPIAPRRSADDAAALAVSAFGGTFASPIGVAAGFDKKGEAIGAVANLGFGHVEIGGVTPAAQLGNARPRVFRLPSDRAVVNRVGLPSEGAEVVAERVRATTFATSAPFRVGVNCAKQQGSHGRVEDFAAVATAFDDLADFVVVNASCPNVTGGVVVDAEDLRAAVRATKKATSLPVLVKLSPDLDAASLREAADAVRREHVDGVVLANTSKKPGYRDALTSEHKDEVGGLSGAPLKAATRALVFEFYALTGGRVPIVGVGGVETAEDAYALIRAGATLVQLYTGLIFMGPSAALKLHDGVLALAREDGFSTVADAVGADHTTSTTTRGRRRWWWWW